MAENVVECSSNYFDGMKIGKAHKKLLWIAAIAYFFDQMDMQMFGFIAPVIQQEWSLSLEQIATMNSISFWGMFVGGLAGGWLANQIGRKKALLTCITIFSMFSFLNGLTSSIFVFCIARFFIGFGTIGMVVIAMVYMAEMLPSENRGKYQAITIACGTIGTPFAATFAKMVVPMGYDSWRLVFFLGGLGILLLPLGLRWLKESPRWLVSKGRVAEAEKIVFEITGRQEDLSAQAANCEGGNVSLLRTLVIMCGKEYRRRTIVLFSLVVGVSVGGFYLTNWYATLFSQMGIAIGVILTILSLSAFGAPVGDFGSSFISDKGGRKTPIIIYLLILCLLYTGIGFCGPTMVVLLTILFFVKAIFTAGSMSMLYTYLAESYPTNIRSNATGIVFSSARVLTAATVWTVPVIYESYGFLGVNLVNVLWFLIPAIIAIFLGEKTAGKTLEELEIQ